MYQPSKSALNMYTIALAYDLRDTPFKVNAVDPGFIATDFNNHRGTGTVQEAGTRIARYAVIGADGPDGAILQRGIQPGDGRGSVVNSASDRSTIKCSESSASKEK